MKTWVDDMFLSEQTKYLLEGNRKTHGSKLEPTKISYIPSEKLSNKIPEVCGHSVVLIEYYSVKGLRVPGSSLIPSFPPSRVVRLLTRPGCGRCSSWGPVDGSKSVLPC